MKSKIVNGIIFLLFAVAAWKIYEYKRSEGLATYYARFSEVDGIQPSALVTLKGVAVGQINHMEIGQDRQVRLTLSIDKTIAMPVGTRAALSSGGANTGKVVEIILGSGDSNLSPGATIPVAMDSNLVPLSHRIQPMFESAKILLTSSEAGLRGFQYALDAGLIQDATGRLQVGGQQMRVANEKIKAFQQHAAGIPAMISSADKAMRSLLSSLRSAPMQDWEKQSGQLSGKSAELKNTNLTHSIQKIRNQIQEMGRDSSAWAPLIHSPKSYRELNEQVKTINEEAMATYQGPKDSLHSGKNK